MTNRSSYQPSGKSANETDYAGAFVKHVHRLLGMGYARLVPANYASADEEGITGCLCDALDAVVDDPQSPAWLRYYSVHEEARISDPKRKGKRRRRLDIRVDSAERRPRARFPFEAKRLGTNHPVADYLGHDGLGRFIGGRYGKQVTVAGMLGYVQSGTPGVWATRIQQTMSRRARGLRLLASSPWRPENLVARLKHTYRSGHDRPTIGKPIEVYHTLLVFN